MCNRACRALHGNIATILAANVTSLPGAWKALRLEEAELPILQEVRMGSAELQKLAADAGCQVVHGAEVEGEILVAVLARKGSLSKVAACPSGQAHHCRWQMGGSTCTSATGTTKEAPRATGNAQTKSSPSGWRQLSCQAMSCQASPP